jgi:hypothetical protein
MKEWFEAFDFIFEKLKPRWKRRDGFLISAVALIATQVFFADTIYALLANLVQGSLLWILICTAYVVPHVLHYVLWLCLSGRLISTNRPFVVAFCVKRYDTLSHLYYSESLSRLSQLLKACNLLDRFHIVDMGSDVVRDNTEASKLVEKSRIKILVHGDIFSGTENGEQTHEHKLQITWKNPPTLGRQIQITNQLDSQLFVGHRDWHIRESTSKADKEKIADSFHEIILLLAVLSQLTDRHQVQMNLCLLETLVNHLEIATRNDKPIVEDGGKRMRLSVPLLRKGRVMFLIKELYREFGRLCIAESDHHNAVIYFERALKIAGPNIVIPKNNVT